MTQAATPARESVLRLAWPLVLSFWMRSLFNFVDTGFAALLGDDAVAAIGLAYPLEFLLIAFWVGTSTGMTSLLSRAMGAREGERIEQVLCVSRRIVAGLIPTFAALGVGVWFLVPSFVRVAPDAPGLAPEVAEYFRIYGTVIVVGSAFTAFWSIIPDSIVKAHHDTRSTMWAGIWSNVLNVLLNALFVLGFGWGVFGIALSTVLGRFGGLAYALVKARSHETRRRAAGRDTVRGTYPRPVRAFAALAVPAAIIYTLMALETTAVNALFAFFDAGTEAIAAYAIYFRYVMFFLMPLIAAGVALLPYTARLWGRRDVEGIRRGFRHVTLAAFAYVGLVVAPVTVLARRPLADLFAEAALTAELASYALVLVPLACLVSLPFFSCRPIFEGMQLAHPGLFIAVLRYVLLTLPCILVGATLATRAGQPAFHGVIWGLILAMAIPSLVLLLWMRHRLGRAADSHPPAAATPPEPAT